MGQAMLTCVKCSKELAQRIARHKASLDDCRRITVDKAVSEGAFVCRCDRCGHRWYSTSKLARQNYELQTAQRE